MTQSPVGFCSCERLSTHPSQLLLWPASGETGGVTAAVLPSDFPWLSCRALMSAPSSPLPPAATVTSASASAVTCRGMSGVLVVAAAGRGKAQRSAAPLPLLPTVACKPPRGLSLPRLRLRSARGRRE